MLSPKARTPSPSPHSAELKQVQAQNARLAEENAKLKAELTALREELHALRSEIRHHVQPEVIPEKRKRTERLPSNPEELPSPPAPTAHLAEITQQLAAIQQFMQQTNIRFDKLEAQIQPNSQTARLPRRDMKPYSRPTSHQEDHPSLDGGAQE